MASDDDENIFIMGGGVSAVRSIYSSDHNLKTPPDSSGNDDDYDSDAVAGDKRRRGRKAKAVGKGLKKRKERSKKTKSIPDSVFDDFVNDGSDESVSLDSDSSAEVTLVSKDDNDIEFVGKEMPQKESHRMTRKEKEKRRRLRRINDTIMNGDDGENALPPFESEEERVLRMKLDAARSAAAAVSAKEVDEAAEEEDQRRREQAAATQKAAEEARVAKLAEERAERIAKETGNEILVFGVRYKGSDGDMKNQRVRVKSHYKLSKVLRPFCAKWNLPVEKAVMYLGNDVLLAEEEAGNQGIKTNCTVDVKVSRKEVVKLKVRIGDKIVCPNVCVRLEDPVLCIRAAVARRQGVESERLLLELDGEEICEGETGEDLALDSGTLIDGSVK